MKPIVNDLGFPVERISAVDGSTLSEKDLKKIVDFETYKKIESILFELKNKPNILFFINQYLKTIKN